MLQGENKMEALVGMPGWLRCKKKKWDLSGDKARSGGACKPDEKLFFIVGNQESLSSDYHQHLYLRFPEGLYEDTLNIKTEKKRLENRVGSGGYWSPSIGEGKGGSERDWEEQESNCSTDLSPASHQRWLWNGDRKLGYSSMIDGMLRTCQGCEQMNKDGERNSIYFSNSLIPLTSWDPWETLRPH